MPLVEKLLANPQHPAPRLLVDETVTDFYRFTKESFALENYKYSEFDVKIPVAI